MQFGSFVGNPALQAALSAAFARRRLPHAMILQGDAGLGKKTLARTLARAAVCRAQNRENAPCGVCSSCIRSAAGSHPDIREILGTGASNAISAEAVDRVLQDAYKRPEEGECNVYLFFVESGISDAAQNKLLKLIEEPPAGTMFLFTVRSADILLPTIRSRAQIFTVSPVDEAEAAAYVSKKTNISPAEAMALAQLHRGNIGNMLSDGSAGRAAKAAHWAESCLLALAEGTEHDLLAAAAPLIREKALFGEVLERMQLLLRDSCMLKNNVQIVGDGAVETARRIGRRLSLAAVMQLVDWLGQCRQAAERNANMTVLVTAMCAKMTDLAGK